MNSEDIPRLEERLLTRCKVMVRSIVSKEFADEMLGEIDVNVRISDESMWEGSMMDSVAMRMSVGLWGYISQRQPDREGVDIKPLSRLEHLKRALFPKRFIKRHPLDNGQPIFERIYLTLGSDTERP